MTDAAEDFYRNRFYDLDEKLRLFKRREAELLQLLDQHNAPTKDKRTGFKLNFVGRTEDLIDELKDRIAELEDENASLEAQLDEHAN